MLTKEKINNKKKKVNKNIFNLLWLDNKNTTLNEKNIIFLMSDVEFAILRSILDWDYSLNWYEYLSSTDREKFISKCALIFDEEWKLYTNDYISYCKRKVENYDNNNFLD
jgi:hypothetical protein